MPIMLNIRITMRSPLHIGSEYQLNTTADRPFLKDERGQPYIPATTIKGRLRYELERLSKSNMHAPRALNMAHPLQSDKAAPDIVSELFGSPWIESPLHFEDLTLVGLPALRSRTGRHPRTTIRTGVSINRYRRVAQDNLLYSTELFAPGVNLVFEGKIIAYTDERVIPIIKIGLGLIEQIGGSRSRGLGWCQAELVQPQLTEAQYAEAERYLREWGWHE